MLLAAIPLLLAPQGAVRVAPQPLPEPLRYLESSNGLGNPQMDGGPTEVEMGDVNGDGFPDLLTIGDHGSPYINTQMHGVTVWFGDGAGNWSVFQNGNFGYGGIALGDANNDGLMDVGYGMHHNYSSTDFGDQLLEVALGDGSGAAWLPWDDDLATAGETWGLAGTDFADVDSDGDLDIGSVGFGSSSGVQVYLNNLDGTWTHSFGFLGGNSENDFVFGDINGDGHADIAFGHASSTTYLGDGQGGFSSGDANLPPLANFGRRGVGLGDVDGDGLLDLSFVTSAGGIEVWLRTAAGGWAQLGGLPASGDWQKTQLADMDLDGYADLVVAGRGRVAVALSDGAGGFLGETMFVTPQNGDMAFLRAGGDADRNGRPDLHLVADEGGIFNSRNHLRFFREASTPHTLRATQTRPGPNATLRAGQASFIDWVSEVPGGGPSSVELELSTSGPAGPWTPVASGLPDNGRYQWAVPATPSSDCRLRLTVDDGSGTSSRVGAPFCIL
ncbi:MAG: VCBS repeat-containing protein [Planctomycetes bacterium]|nr:VCBS repeat-containing protein [Planctomycetota bacterium]